MPPATPLTQRIRDALRPTDRGVVGVVDELLGLCRGQSLQLAWRADRCRVQALDGDGQDAAEMPLPKAVFRAILARLAALCNESSPNSVSPYRGEGEIVTETARETVFHVAFVNTADDQRVVIRQTMTINGQEQVPNASLLR